MSDCRTCELVERRDAGSAPLWDRIIRTPNWDVAHAYDTSIEGWMVLVVRRHITAVADLIDGEALELGPLIKKVSQALQHVVGCVKTYVAEFAEDPLHPHVHLHVIPRFTDQPEDQRGPRIFSRLGVDEDRCVPEGRMNTIAKGMQAYLHP